MMDLVAELSDPGDLMVAFWAGTMAVEMACLLLCDHRHFLGSQKGEGCVEESLQGLVEVCALVLSSESNFISNEEISDATRVFSAELNGIQARRVEDIWSPAIELPPVQSFPHHVLHFLLSYHQYL